MDDVSYNDLLSTISDLSWNKSAEEQKIAMERIRTAPCFNYAMLIRFGSGKDCWDNCAELICELPDEQLRKLLPRLLEWLQDMNWPGAYAVYTRLLALPVHMLKRPYEIIVQYADLMDDELWIESLALFCDKLELMSVITDEVRSIIERVRGEDHS